MGEELVRKKRVRAGHKASATRMMRAVDEVLTAGEDLDQARLNQLGMSLKEKLEEIKVLDNEILSLVADDELDDEISQADLYKEQVYSTLIKIEKPTAATPLTPATAVALPHGNKVRLPKLTIKPFNGKLTAWTPF